MWRITFLLFACLPCTFSYINLYLEDKQVYRLFGIQDAQLFYIRDGVVNQNALNFEAQIQPEHEKLEYIWHTTTSDAHILFDISLHEKAASGCDGISSAKCDSVIKRPVMTLNDNGVVPTELSTFVVTVACTGERDGNVTIYTRLKLTMPDASDPSVNVDLNVEIKRLKLCRKIYSNALPPTQHPPVVVSTPTTQDNSVLSSHQSTSVFYISISVITVIIIVIVIAVGIWHMRVNKRHAVLGPETSHAVQTGPSITNQFLRPDLPNNAQKPPSTHASLVQFTPLINDLGRDISEVRSKLMDISIPRSKVDLDELFLEGTFSRIYRGCLEDGVPVLAKTVTDAATEEQRRLLLFEGSMFRSVQHRNLLSIKHVILDDEESPPVVIFPFMGGSNLKHYLQHCRSSEAPGLFAPSSDKYEQASTQDLVHMSIQVACGMTYLSKRGFVHKDLAARNCVIDGDLNVKITDNALSRDVFPADYSCLADKENRPIRWLALESLVHKVFSSASDVWSFGVVLWELQSLAARPYNEIDDFEMAEYLSDGFRLSQPANCPDHLYNIMAGCWHYSPDQRLPFSHLLQMLTEFHAELGDYV